MYGWTVLAVYQVLVAALATTFVTLTTPSSPVITPPPRLKLLHRRAEECGDLQSQYPNAVAPTCAGSFSICTFTGGYQGCCDASNNCRFYTSCQGGLVSGTNRCSASSCLQCPSLIPICTRYKFTEGVSAYVGFACGNNPVPADLIVQGIVGSRQVDASATDDSSQSGSTTSSSTTTTTSSSTSSTSQFSSTSSTSLTSSTNSTNSTRSTSPTSATSVISAAGATATAGGRADAQPDSKGLSTGAIAGIAVGAVAAIALLGWCFYAKCWANRNRRTQPTQLQQPSRQRI